ncbi:uncharacterized protein BO88DRAFT_419563 [Aspergillus vadensis CBS 113365]|uniref:Uncharacterized protein n=1 Tax=Aspergillus vadensis (strain CBS 113365 / IMI 142717 / IBT 24658) TaxID=1448311 RepID=A0A319AVS3_ASPVC|nr:hypothetical protein BO88DRAFT_419563 [Aspergillus vadensis CBS 113365]PYH64359.1 hypothetical protein BO88DRAFT_419563 [Aspergillus vadensis CBS 113365]
MATEALVEHWKSGLEWWFPRRERFSISEECINTFQTAMYILTVSHYYSPVTFKIILGNPGPNDPNRHIRLLANRVRPTVTPMLNSRGEEVHPWGATVTGDSLATYRRIGDNPLSVFDRFPDGMPSIAAADSPMAYVFERIRRDFEETAVHDNSSEGMTPSLSDADCDEWPVVSDSDGGRDGVPIRANIGASRVFKREYSPETAAYLVDAPSHSSFDSHSYVIRETGGREGMFIPHRSSGSYEGPAPTVRRWRDECRL